MMTTQVMFLVRIATGHHGEGVANTDGAKQCAISFKGLTWEDTVDQDVVVFV